jgi:hypothetical protein
LWPRAGVAEGDQGLVADVLARAANETGTRLVRHGRYALFLKAEAALPRAAFHAIIDRINALRGPPTMAASA